MKNGRGKRSRRRRRRRRFQVWILSEDLADERQTSTERSREVIDDLFIPLLKVELFLLYWYTYIYFSFNFFQIKVFRFAFPPWAGEGPTIQTPTLQVLVSLRRTHTVQV